VQFNAVFLEGSMNSTSVWESNVAQEVAQESSGAKGNGTSGAKGSDSGASHQKIETLKELTFRILHEVQSMREVGTPNIDNGIDFYDEVTRFEIDLIKRALMQTRGHQGRAARLLNLKITTLNSKIKHYGIKLDGFAAGFVPALQPPSNALC